MSVKFFSKGILVFILIFLIGITLTNATCTYKNVQDATIQTGDPTQVICLASEDVTVGTLICEISVLGNTAVTLTDYAEPHMTSYVSIISSFDDIVTDIQFIIKASIDDITDTSSKSLTGALNCGGSPNDMFILSITVVNDHTPQFSEETYTLSGVSEAFPPVYDLFQFYDVSIYSQDGDTNGDASSKMDFSIISGDDEGTFGITTDDANCNSTYCVPKLTVVGKLDYSRYPSYDLVLQVQDEGTPILSSSATLTVTVDDTDNLNPKFESTFYYSTADQINEGQYDLIMTPSPINAFDQDTGINAPIQYRLIIDTCGPSCDAIALAFTIDPSTGIITFDSNVDLDPISNGLATFGVQAVQTDNPDRSTLAIVSVTLPSPPPTTTPQPTTETTTPTTTTTPPTTTACPTIPPTTTTLTTTPTSTITTVVSTVETTVTTCTTVTFPTTDTTTTPEPTTITQPTTTGLTSTGATCYCPTTDTTPTIITLTTTDCPTDSTVTSSSQFTSSTTPYTVTTNTGSTVTITTSGSNSSPVTSYTCSPSDSTTLSTATVTGNTTPSPSTDCTGFPTDTTIPSTGSTTPFTGSTSTVDPTATSSSLASTTPFTGTTTPFTGTTTVFTGTTTQYTGTVTINTGTTGMTCYPTGSTDPITGTTGTGTTPTGQTTGTTGTGTEPTGQTTQTAGTGSTCAPCPTTPSGQTTGTTGTGTEPTGQTTQTAGTGSTCPPCPTTSTTCPATTPCPTSTCPICPTSPPDPTGSVGEIVMVSVLTPVNTDIIKITDTLPASFQLNGGDPYFAIDADQGNIIVKSYLQIGDYTLTVTITPNDKAILPEDVQVYISVVDGNEFPILPRHTYLASINEDQEGKVPLVDLTSIFENRPSIAANYSIVQVSPIDSFGKFSLDSTTGELFATGPFDCENEETSIDLIIQVTPVQLALLESENDLMNLSASQYLVIVNVTDLNDNAPIFNTPDNSNSLTLAISSYTSSGQQVTQLTTTDIDIDPRNRITTYASTDSGNNFYVDENTGLLLASQPLKSLTQNKYTVTVTAKNTVPYSDNTLTDETLSITIYMLVQDQILVIYSNYSIGDFEINHDQILSDLSASLNSALYLPSAASVVQIGSLKWVAEDAGTKAYLYGLKDNNVMSHAELKSLLTDNAEAFTNAKFVPTTAKTFDQTSEAAVNNGSSSNNTGLIAGISVLAALLGICLIVGGVYGYKSYKKKKELDRFYDDNNDDKLESSRKPSYNGQSEQNNMMYNERRLSQAVNHTVNTHEYEGNHLSTHDEDALEEVIHDADVLENVIHNENHMYPNIEYKDDSPPTQIDDVLREFQTVDNLNEIHDFPEPKPSNSISEIESPIADYEKEIHRASVILDEEPAKSILIDPNSTDSDTLEDLQRKEELNVTFNEVAEVIAVDENAPHDNLLMGEDDDEEQLE